MVDVATKPPVSNIWANSAANPADIVAPAPSFVEAGWPLSSTPPPRQYFNWILNFCANAVRYFSRRGLVDYDAAETYLINDIVRGDDNVIYQSLQSTNIGNTPSTSPLWWGPANYYPKTVAELNGGVTIVNAACAPGDVRRYGVIPNLSDSTTVTNNTEILQDLWDYTITPGPVGNFWFPNTTGSDFYQINDFIPMRRGISIDLQRSILQCTKAAPTGNEAQSGFLMALGDLQIKNGKIIVSFASAVGACAAIFLGSRSEGFYFPNSWDSLLPAPMGNIRLTDLYVQSNMPGTACIQGLGGLQNVEVDNVWADGQGVSGGIYMEFGWATSGSRYQRYTSHPHNLRFTNIKVTNMETAGVYAAIGVNGGYGITVDGLDVSVASGLCEFGTGESMFYRPQVGVSDGPVSQRTVSIRNAVGKGITSIGFGLLGTTPAQNAAGVPGGYWGWGPGKQYISGDFSFNGPGIYQATNVAAGLTQAAGTFSGSASGSTLTVIGSVTGSPIAIGNDLVGAGIPAGITIASGSGTSWGLSASVGTIAAEPMTVTKGPKGTGSGIVDGAVTWNYVGPAAPHETDLLTFVMDGFLANQTPSFGSYGILCTGGRLDARNGRLINFSRAVNCTSECTHVNIENVEGFGSAGIGINLGGGFPIWSPNRLGVFRVNGCFVAGSGGDGVSAGPAIFINDCASAKIDANRFGYNPLHDGASELTQLQAVSVSANAFNVSCDANTVAGVSSGPAFTLINSGSSSRGCKFANTYFDPSVPVPTIATTGLWENLLTSSISADNGDNNVAFQAHRDCTVQLFATTFTANHTVTLNLTNAVQGDKFRIVRTGLGAFSLGVGPTGKTMPISTAAWLDAEFNGTTWIETGYGTL